MFDRVGAAHFNAGGASGLLRGHATTQLVRGGRLNEPTQFIVHFAFDTISMEQRTDSPCDIA